MIMNGILHHWYRFSFAVALIVALAGICAAQDPEFDADLEFDTNPESATPAEPAIIPLPSFGSASPELFPARAQPENTRSLVNLWDGVDGDGDLCVFVARVSVLDDVGRMRDTSFPPSPNFVDMNNDGLKDLVVGDGRGFVWIYLNSGEPGKPKFTTGEFLQTFTGWGSRVHVADWDQDSDEDLIIGTFYGDICIFENTGTRQQWRFNRGMGVPRYVDPRFGVDDARIRLPQVRLGKQPLVLGIYMAPWVTDWNGNGKPDLLFGEGTYSANSVRIAFNKGSRGKPSFVEDGVFFLAYGEGYEQLTPAVVDYNGDGINDLLVGTRTGQIRKFKGTKEAIEGKDMVAALRSSLAPAVLEPDGNLEIGRKEVWDTMTCLYPCDWNEDGLFDLVLSSTRGKLYIAINKGTKSEPFFPDVAPIKGTDVAKNLLGPAQWGSGFGGECNAALLLSSETEVVLTPGTPPVKPVAGERFMYFRYIAPVGSTEKYIGWTRGSSGYRTGGRSIVLNGSLRMEIGKRYEFSFNSLLRGKSATWRMRASELVRPATDTSPASYAQRDVSDTVIPSGAWQRRSYTFTCPGLHKTKSLSFGLSFNLGSDDAVLLLDNFSLKEVGR